MPAPSMMPPAAITGMSSCRTRSLVSTIVPRQLSGTSGLNTPCGRQLHSLALRHYRMDASIGNGWCLIGILGRGKQDDPASRSIRTRSGARTPKWKLTTFGFS